MRLSKSKDSSEMSSTKDQQQHAYLSVKDQHYQGQKVMTDYKKDFDISELDLSSQGTVPEDTTALNTQIEKQKTL